MGHKIKEIKKTLKELSIAELFRLQTAIGEELYRRKLRLLGLKGIQYNTEKDLKKMRKAISKLRMLRGI